MKRRHTTPRYYARNAAMQAQRRFLRTGKTEAERLDDHREATANVLVLCILAAIYNKYGIGEMRLQRVVDCANEISAKYALEKQVRGEERAKATLVAAVWWFMPPFLLPALSAPKTEREAVQLAARRDAADMVMKIYVQAMHKALGEGGIIAEDLGYLTPEVKAMLAASGYPGMKIMQFAFDSREPGNYLPYTYPRNSVVYTGTHDNVTAEGWRQSASAEDVAYACRYLRCAPEDLTEAMICACLSCVSDMAVIPLADWLHLDAEARINTPSTQGANWQWRLTQPLTPALSAHIAELTTLYHRVPGEEL